MVSWIETRHDVPHMRPGFLGRSQNPFMRGAVGSTTPVCHVTLLNNLSK